MPFPKLVANGWFPSGIPWTWYTGGVGTGGAVGIDASLGYEGGNHATFTIIVPYDSQPWVWASDLLGTNTVNPNIVTGNSQLVRQAPMQHPLAPHLYCSRIVSAKPFSANATQFKAQFPSGFVGPFYNYWMLTLDFTQPKWNRTLSDPDFYRIYGANAGEWNRFTTFLYRPSIETLMRVAGAFKWAEGPGAGGAGDAGKFNSPTMVSLAKADVILIWHRIPKFKGLFSTAKVRPENIDAAVGKLNNATFLNYPTNTLRLNPPEIIELEDPVPWISVNVNANIGQTSIMCDVAFPFSFWDPPIGAATTHGHNNAPYGDKVTNPDGNWYLVTSDGTGAGSTIYQTTDMTKIFQLPT